ncbi:uncharacterized protein TNCV_2244711 [Trichonephila clavipes]|nr:uncharacterized protein TNCV_2244711 [Trichonephila clavipes]
MSRTDESTVSIYEKKISRFIFGGIQENGTWRRRSNFELYIPHIKNLISLTSSKYNELNGQAMLSEWTKTVPIKKVFNAQLIGTRRKGRPNVRWIDSLEKDLLVLSAKN